jgi:hypothetical protein
MENSYGSGEVDVIKRYYAQTEKKVLIVGAGSQQYPRFLTIDVLENVKPDLVLDIEKVSEEIQDALEGKFDLVVFENLPSYVALKPHTVYVAMKALKPEGHLVMNMPVVTGINKIIQKRIEDQRYAFSDIRNANFIFKDTYFELEIGIIRTKEFGEKIDLTLEDQEKVLNRINLNDIASVLAVGVKCQKIKKKDAYLPGFWFHRHQEKDETYLLILTKKMLRSLS